MGNFFSLLFPTSPPLRILMVGLDGAGKTSILYKLKFGEVVQTIPTIGFNVETIQYHGININVWDVGGQEKIRVLWRHYYADTDGLIFVIDSNDEERILEASIELEQILDDELMNPGALLVIANKQDLPNAQNPEEIAENLGFEKLKDGKLRWRVQPCCAITGEGLSQGMDWFVDNLKKHNKASSSSTSGKT